MAKRKEKYWCEPQRDGHATLYFRGQRLISRTEYIDAVGPGDCDPHISQGTQARRRKRRARKAH